MFTYLNFVLRFSPTHPSETALMERFAKIGIGAGKTIDVAKLSPEMKTALEQGIADAWAEFATVKAGVRRGHSHLRGRIRHARVSEEQLPVPQVGDEIGIYGNSRKEASTPKMQVDAAGQKLDGAYRYTLRFAPGQLPPVNAFWSLTMYELPASLLVANPINRYLINSPMLPRLKKDADGGLTVLRSRTNPPARTRKPTGCPRRRARSMAMRLYWPKEAA